MLLPAELSDSLGLLLADRELSPKCERLLRNIGFERPESALLRLRTLCANREQADLFASPLQALLHALLDAANPDQSLLNFQRFVERVPDRIALFSGLRARPRAIEILIKLFVNSEFLSEILIRHPDHLERLTEHKRVAEFKSRADFENDGLQELQGAETIPEVMAGLRRFHQWELLRLAACDTFGLMDLKTVTLQLALLADAIVRIALDRAAADEEVPADEFAVLAFGKLGGEELNYSSDIDLVFLSDRESERFWGLGRKLIRILSDPTDQGFLYRVDMRLRPWGNAGPLVTTIDGYADYMRRSGAIWEKQALLKARCIAGNPAIGKAALTALAPFVSTVSADAARKNIVDMKTRIEGQLAKRGQLPGDVKNGAGGIRDIEFVVQYLQLIHGTALPYLRTTNTLDGLVRLADFNVINAEEFRCLSTGYLFLRTIEHALQLMHNRQEHRIPPAPRELAFLARRLDFPDMGTFVSRVASHTVAVRTIFDRHLRSDSRNGEHPPEAQAPEDLHFGTAAQSYRETFTAEAIAQHLKLLEQLDESHPVRIAATDFGGGRFNITVVGFDRLGDLSAICGLITAYGLDIVDGDVFTGAEVETPRVGRTRTRSGSETSRRRKFVNVFSVRRLDDPLQDAPNIVWKRFEEELVELVCLVRQGNREEMQARLTQRVAMSLKPGKAEPGTLFPIEIEIDEEVSPETATLRILGNDSPGFLYELTNATAINGLSVIRMSIRSRGGAATDTLKVVDDATQRAPDPERLKKLRVAIVLIKHFTHLLSQAPNPVASLKHFRELLESLFQQPDWAEQLSPLNNSEVLERVVRLLGISDFLWEDFLRVQHRNLFPVLADDSGLQIVKDRSALLEELRRELAATPPPDRKTALNAFKDREMLRVDMRHILGLQTEFSTFGRELTAVAEATVAGALELCLDDLQQTYGLPTNSCGRPIPLCICALGKFGGREMGYASDVELMFIHEGDGRTAGPQTISHLEFQEILVEKFVKTIDSRRKGIFEIDLRLRPYGSAGPLAVSLASFERYFNIGGDAWPYERQALVKLRPVAGDDSLGEKITQLRDRILYSGLPFDLNAMRAMRERQVRELTHAGTFNAKFSPGGVVDCEYLVQALQIQFGHLHPSLRATNTRDAMKALEQFDIISGERRLQLRDAYRFLRRLIDGLRVVRGNAGDLNVPLPGSNEFLFLARRLGYGDGSSLLAKDLEQHTRHVLSAVNELDLLLRHVPSGV